jgi:hypothetical protein
MNFQLLTISFSVLIILLTSVPLLPTAQAQEVNFSLKPANIVIEAQPPATISNTITIRNGSDHAVELLPTLKPFTPSESGTGQPQFVPAMDIPKETTTLLQHVQLKEDGQKVAVVSLSPKQEKELELVIAIPEATPIKDYYFTLVLRTNTKEHFEGNASLVSAGVGSNILLSLGNRKTSQLFVKEFSTDRFLNKGPVVFRVTITNPSSQMVTPTGTITIKNMFGQRIGVVSVLPQNILADSSRSLTNDTALKNSKDSVLWNESFLLGFYEALLTLSVDGEKVVEKKTRFIVIPTHILIISGVVLILTLFLYQRVKKRL